MEHFVQSSRLITKICRGPEGEGGYFAIDATRADQNTGGPLLEFPKRTAMHGKSRVSSAVSV